LIALIDAVTGRGLGVYQTSDENNTTKSFQSPQYSQYFPVQLDMVICGVLKVGWYHRRILGAHMEAFLLLTACTMWTSVNHFLHSLDNCWSKEEIIFVGKHMIIEMECCHSHSDNDKRWLGIYKQYLSLKQLTNMINSVIGPSVTCALFAGILEYAIGLDEIFVEKSSQLKNSAAIIFYFLSKISFVLISADVCRKMTTFKEWLSVDENRVGIPSDQLSFIINELDTNVVAIKGSNIFPLTYGLAANVSKLLNLIAFAKVGERHHLTKMYFLLQLAGITITYFIICVQV